LFRPLRRLAEFVDVLEAGRIAPPSLAKSSNTFLVSTFSEDLYFLKSFLSEEPIILPIFSPLF